MTALAARHAALALAVVALAAAAYAALARPRASRLPVYGAAPAFDLVDQAGRRVRAEDLRGRAVLANFVYTACTETCPTLSARMAAVARRLREAGLLGARVGLLSFSVDPAHDTPEVLARYAARFGDDGDAWRFLTGPPEVVRAVLAQGFRLAVQPLPAADGAHGAHGGPILHTNRFVLLDGDGRVRAYYDGLDLDPEAVLRDVRELAG